MNVKEYFFHSSTIVFAMNEYKMNTSKRITL